MPPAAAAVVGAVITGVTAGATVGTVLGVSALAGGIIAGAASLALSFASQALAPSPELPSFSLPNLQSFEQQVTARTAFIRQPITARRLPFGEIIIGGVLTFYEATDDGRYHHMVVTLGDAPAAAWDGIGIVWLDSEPVFPSQIDGSGDVTEGKFAGKVRIRKHLGGPDQVADAELIAAVDRLDSNFRGRGVAYLYIRVDWDRELFPNGLPKPRAICRTNTVLDARDDTRRYTPNATLALSEYLTEPTIALGYDADADLEDAFTVAAANLCDEIVDVKACGQAIAAVDAGSDALDLCIAGSGAPIRLETGDRVEIFAESGGSAPGGTSTGTDYYAIVDRLVAAPFDDGDATEIALSSGDYSGAAADAIDAGTVDAVHGTGWHARIGLATSYANALAGTRVTITGAGSGQSLVVRTGEPRYAVSGIVETDRTPKDNIDDLLSAMAGRLFWTGGQFRIQAGGYVTPTLSLDEGDLMDAFTVTGRRTRRDRANAVKGIFAPHIAVGEATDYPPVIDSTYVANDGGERVWMDFDLRFTSRPSMAQRLAKIRLARLRRETQVSYPGTPKCLRAVPGTVVKLTNTRRSWTDETFEVIRLTDTYYPTEGRDAPPLLGATLALQAIDSTVFDFDPDSDETIKPPRAIPAGGNPLTVAPPTGLAASSGTADLDLRLDGSVFSRLHASWTAPADGFVTGGGHIEIRYKKSSESEWLFGPTVRGDATDAYILDVRDGVAYDIAARAVNQIGRASDIDPDPANWQATVIGHTVAGKEQDPSDVASLTAQQNGDVTTFRWPAIADLDRAGYTLKYAPLGAFEWGSATEISRETKGTLVTNAALPPGSWTLGIKARDTSGHESANAATFDIVVGNANDVVAGGTDEAPRWPGAMSGLVRHDVSGSLIPRAATLAADLSDAELWDAPVADPVAAAWYEAAEIDLGFDADGSRVWADVGAALCPGESGFAAAALSIDYREAAGSYDGFETWSVGTADFRYLRARAVLDAAQGVAALARFAPTVDVAEHRDVQNGVAIDPGGTTVSWGRTFHGVPSVQVTAQAVGGAARFGTYENVTATHGEIRVFTAAGADVGGTVNITAEGP